MPVAFFRIDYGELMFAVELWLDFVNGTRVIVLSTYVLAEFTRLETKTDLLVAVCQISDVTHNRVHPVCALGHW